MKFAVTLAFLICCFFADRANAGTAFNYNLRTDPSSPAAGQPFAAVFDDTQCESFLLTFPAQPPSVQIQGTVVTVAADRFEVLDCSSPSATYSIPVAGLPAGNYTLELLARVMGEPGNQVVEASVPIVVGQATAVDTFTIPATGWESLAVLGMMIALGMWLHSRRR